MRPIDPRRSLRGPAALAVIALAAAACGGGPSTAPTNAPSVLTSLKSFAYSGLVSAGGLGARSWEAESITNVRIFANHGFAGWYCAAPGGVGW